MKKAFHTLLLFDQELTLTWPASHFSRSLMVAGYIVAYATFSSVPAHAGVGDNMGFENGFSEWTQVSGSWNANNNNSYIRTGSKSAKIQVNSSAQYVLKSSTATYTVPSGMGYIVVTVWGKANINNECLLKVGVVNTSTGVYTWSSSFTTLTSSGFTQVSSGMPVTVGATYAPAVMVSRTATGSTDMIYVDDVHFYTNTSSTPDNTPPSAPKSIDISTSGNSITLSWINGTDAESGLTGVVVLRSSGIQTGDATLNDGGTYHTTNTDIGPITVGIYSIIYCGSVVTTLTDNPGATGTYSYLIYMKDNALNYTSATTAARAWVFNGTSLSASTSSNSGIDGLYVPATCTLQTNPSSSVQVRNLAICNVWGTLTNQGNLLNDLGGTVTMKNGSLYKYDRNGASGYPVLNATWQTGSTCSITGITNGTTPLGLDQSFSHFTWNSPNQTAQQNLPTGFAVNGNATFTNSGVSSPSRIVSFNGTSYLRGNLSCSATAELGFASGSNVRFDGTAQQTIQTSGPEIAFYNLTQDNSAGILLLSNVKVSSVCTLSQGLLNTGSYELHLTSNSNDAIIHTPNRYVVGTLRRTIINTGNVTYDFPIGTASNRQFVILRLHDLGGVATIAATFNSTITGSNPNSQSCTVGTVGLGSLLNNGFWTIAPNQQPTSGTYDVTLRPKGFSNGQPTCYYYSVLKRENSLASWAMYGEDDLDAKWQSGNVAIVKRKELTSFSDFAIGTPNGTILPITLVDFNIVTDSAHHVILSWETASELNNASFTVQRSTNGIDFENLYALQGAGTSTTPHRYEYIDKQAMNGVNYYRLVQSDFDGAFSYSPIRFVTVSRNVLHSNKESDITVYPNPGKGLYNIERKHESAEKNAIICVYNMRSEPVLKQVSTGKFDQIDLTSHPPGVYAFKTTDALGTSVLKFVVRE